MRWLMALPVCTLRLEKVSRAEVKLESGLKPEQLKGMGRCNPPGMGTWELYVSKMGDVYVKGLAETTLSGVLFPIHGLFKTGSEASTLLEQGGGMIPYKLTESSKVLLRPKSGKTLPSALAGFLGSPVPLQEVLKAMTAASLPQCQIHLHKVEAVTEQGKVNWKVHALEAACLKPTILEPNEGGEFPPAEITPAKISCYVNLANLTHVEMVFALEYDDQANKFKGMLPQACMKATSSLPKDVIAKL